jgi:hypothetical protein
MESKGERAVTAAVHLLVDFENLKPTPGDVACIRTEKYRLWVFHGPHQNKFDAVLVKSLQPLGDRVDFIQCSKHGKNALDFHIAFKLGVLHAEDKAAKRQATFVVVSGDGGFEPLLEYMRTLECTVTRAGSISEALAIPMPTARSAEPSVAQVASRTVGQRPSRGIIPAATQAPTASTPKKKAAANVNLTVRRSISNCDAAIVVAELRAHPKNRPSDRAALERYIAARLGNKVAPEVAKAVIRELEQQTVVTFDGKKVDYQIPKAKQ